MSETATTLRFVPYVPEGFEGAPVDVVDALKRGRAVLAEEDSRWTRGEWFCNSHPEVDIQDPFCNSWKVCAEGAVLVVTVGVSNYPMTIWEDDDDDLDIADPDFWSEDSPPWEAKPQPTDWTIEDQHQRDLYYSAINSLRRTAERIVGSYRHEANAYNDRDFETRDQVIDWFDQTIADAEEAQR